MFHAVCHFQDSIISISLFPPLHLVSPKQAISAMVFALFNTLDVKCSKAKIILAYSRFQFLSFVKWCTVVHSFGFTWYNLEEAVFY